MDKRVNCYGKFGLLTKDLVYLVTFATGSLVLMQNVLVYYSSAAVQWNDFKIFFALTSSFQHTKDFVRKIMAALEPS